MEYLQVPDAFLRRAMAEWLAMGAVQSFGVTENASPVVLHLAGQECNILADGQPIEIYALPLRLPAVMADLVWFFAQRSERANQEISLGDYLLLPHAFALKFADQMIALTGREVAMLQFMARAGECTKESLLMDVWRYHPDSDTHTVETHLWRLRQKLQTAGMAAPLVVTTDKGYRIA